MLAFIRRVFHTGWVSDRIARRWLRERDEARAEADAYRAAAQLHVGEFVGPDVTATKIRQRIQDLQR